MLPLPTNITLSKRAIRWMKKWQDAITKKTTYKEQIEEADRTWGKSNKTFDEIKSKLRQMSNKTKRCNYCEDSFADEIEHIYPKNIYPEKTFIWENYLYACGPCNGPKSDKFALINLLGKLQDITPPKPIPDNHIFVKPPNLQVALIDPRVENPTNFIELDIIQTFRFIPMTGIEGINKLRAEYTIDILRLNEREYLVQARENAFDDYKARLVEYIQERDNGAKRAKLEKMKKRIQQKNHASVWFEMKRSHQYVQELKMLFDQAPEALNW